MNKLLALLQILIKETDENHKLTTNQLIERKILPADRQAVFSSERLSKGRNKKSHSAAERK